MIQKKKKRGQTWETSHSQVPLDRCLNAKHFLNLTVCSVCKHKYDKYEQNTYKTREQKYQKRGLLAELQCTVRYKLVVFFYIGKVQELLTAKPNVHFGAPARLDSQFYILKCKQLLIVSLVLCVAQELKLLLLSIIYYTILYFTDFCKYIALNSYMREGRLLPLM